LPYAVSKPAPDISGPVKGVLEVGLGAAPRLDQDDAGGCMPNPDAGAVSSREGTRGLIRRGTPICEFVVPSGASCGTGLEEGQLNCCLSPLGGLIYPVPGHDPADFESCVNQVHLGDPPGGHVDQVDRGEYSGSTDSESARLTNAAGG
jgi:hypothetical protein